MDEKERKPIEQVGGYIPHDAETTYLYHIMCNTERIVDALEKLAQVTPAAAAEMDSLGVVSHMAILREPGTVKGPSADESGAAAVVDPAAKGEVADKEAPPPDAPTVAADGAAAHTDKPKGTKGAK